MRRIFEATFVSLDGVISEPHVWASPYFDEKAQKKALERLLACDAMLIGRRTYDIFANLWPTLTGEYAGRLNSMRKYVFSSTLATANWNNSTIVRGDAVAGVKKIKEQEGGDLITYGHGLFGQTLLRHGLLDEESYSIHPVFVGSGKLLFEDGEKATLNLVASERLETGVVVLTYEPVGTHDQTA